MWFTRIRFQASTVDITYYFSDVFIVFFYFAITIILQAEYMDVLDFQAIGKTIATVLQSANDKSVDPIVFMVELGPEEKGPPLHLHPHQTEEYEVLEGEVEFMLGKEKKVFRKGETVHIPPNTPHTFQNISSGWSKMKDTHTPALSFEEMMRELHGLVVSGKVTGFNDFKSLIYVSMLWVKHDKLQRSVNPPFFVMRILAVIGRIFGFTL